MDAVLLRMPMTEPHQQNNLSWRVTVLEREMERLKEGKPDVVAEQVRNLRDDFVALRQEMRQGDAKILEAVEKGDAKNSEENASQRRIVIGFSTAIAIGLITVYVTSGGNPVG